MSTPGLARAKRAYLRVEKRDKYGRKYVGQNDVIVSHGMFSAREAERELQKAADSSTERVVDMAVETYGPRENPEMHGTPRRGDRQNAVFGGFGGAAWPPESPTLRRIASRREEGAPAS